MQSAHHYDDKNYEGGKEGIVDPSSGAYGYTDDMRVGESVEFDEAETKRELKPRQISMIAIGGAIGTGKYLRTQACRRDHLLMLAFTLDRFGYWIGKLIGSKWTR
jgi:amino acid permease